MVSLNVGTEELQGLYLIHTVVSIENSIKNSLSTLSTTERSIFFTDNTYIMAEYCSKPEKTRLKCKLGSKIHFNEIYQLIKLESDYKRTKFMVQPTTSIIFISL